MTSSLLSIYPQPTTAFKIETNLSKELWCSHYYILHSSTFWLTMFNLSPVHVCLGLAKFCIRIFIYTTTRLQESVLKVRILVYTESFSVMVSSGHMEYWLWLVSPTPPSTRKTRKLSHLDKGYFSTWFKASVWYLYFLLYLKVNYKSILIKIRNKHEYHYLILY